VPDPESEAPRAQRSVPVREVLRDRELARLNLGIFTLHAILMALFVIVPLQLEQWLPGAQHWQVYLPVMLGGVALMVPVMLVSERKGRRKMAFLGAIGLLAASTALLGLAGALASVVLALLLFFAAFNLLEATLPSIVSRLAPAAAKGTAIGLYSTTQFVGTFAGAALGGWLAQHFGAQAVYLACVAAACLWLLAASGMHIDRVLATRRYRLPTHDVNRAQSLVQKLAVLPGVREALLTAEGVAMLRVDSSGFDEQNVLDLLSAETS
jgi:MFS family permease